MKKKRLRLHVIGIAGIIILFIISTVYAPFQPFAKAGVILIYAVISYVSLMDTKKQGYDIEKSTLFTIAVVIAITYLLFFV